MINIEKCSKYKDNYHLIVPFVKEVLCVSEKELKELYYKIGDEILMLETEE
jgi:hypothetical protein